jgi:4'-phosphopantetheinyl transferase EntD
MQRFVRWLPGVIETSEGVLLPYAQVRFDLARFAPALFIEANIDMPASLRQASHKRQAEFLAGRLCARAAAGLFGASESIPPGPDRAPVWPAGLIGSITHSERYAAAVACPEARFAGIGIDIETVVDEASRQSLLALVVSAEELECIAACSDRIERDVMLTLVFSAKESFYKAAYSRVGRFFGFEAIRLRHIDAAARTLHFEVMEPLAPALPVHGRIHASYALLEERSVLTAVLLKRA